MDSRLTRLKPTNPTVRPTDPKSPSQDARTQFTADSPGTGSGGSTPLHSHKFDHNPTYLSHDDANQMATAFIKLGVRSGDVSLYRKKKQYLREESKATASELKRAEQQAAQFPIIIEQARKAQISIDSRLERTEKAVRDSSEAESAAAHDLVRLFFSLISRDNPKVKSLEDQHDTVKKDIQEMRTEYSAKLTELDTQVKTLTTENSDYKARISFLEDKVRQLQSRPCPDSHKLATSLETVQRENQEQIPNIRDLQGLTAKLENQLKDLTAEGVKAANRAHAVDSKIEDLQKEMAKKGSQLAIKGLEAQIQSQKINLEAASQVNGEMATELKSLKELPTASTHGSSETLTSRKFEELKQTLNERIDDSNRARKADIEALRAQNNLIHVSTTLAQLESLDVLVNTHSRDINLIKDKHATLLSSVDEKIAEIQKHESLTGLQKQLTDIQNRLSSLGTQPYTEIQREHATAEMRSMLEELRREKTDQIEASHDLITREIEETKGKTAVLQSQIDALKKAPDQRDDSPTTISNDSNAARAIATLSHQVEELELRVEKLQREPTAHDEKHSSIEIWVQALKDEISSHDKMISTLFSAQMSSQDREALQSAKILTGRMEKAEHQHQWLRTRFDNLTTETLHRQIIGYIAPVLPRLEQGFVRIEAKTENLENMVNEKFTRLEASVSKADNKSQLLEDSSTTSITKLQEQQDSLLKQFQEGRNSMREEIKKLQDWRVEVQEQQQDLKQNLDADASKKRTGSSTRSVRDSSTPRNKSVQSGLIQKASTADWVIGESDDDNDELRLTDEDARKEWVRRFQKPAEPKESPSERKRKRDTPSINGDGRHQESGDNLSNLNLPRKRAQGQKSR